MTPIDHAESGLPTEVADAYVALGRLPDGRLCGVHRLMFHWTLHIDIDATGYAERYCFTTQGLAMLALSIWNGEGDPVGWHRHPESGRRRDPDTAREWRDDLQ